MDIEDYLKSESYIDVRQKYVLASYSFLQPIARGFMSEFHDSRYLRWAIQHYRRISEWVFYRKLDLSPAITSELVDVSNPYGLWRMPSSSRGPVLEKYNIASDDPTGSPSILPGGVPMASSSDPSPAPSMSASVAPPTLGSNNLPPQTTAPTVQTAPAAAAPALSNDATTVSNRAPASIVSTPNVPNSGVDNIPLPPPATSSVFAPPTAPDAFAAPAQVPATAPVVAVPGASGGTMPAIAVPKVAAPVVPAAPIPSVQ